MTEEGPKAEPEHIPLSGDVINGSFSYKALQPQRQLESQFSSERRWMDCWLWAAVAVWGAMVVSAAVVSWWCGCCCCAAVGKIPSQIPRENLLIFYSESRRFCSVFARGIFC